MFVDGIRPPPLPRKARRPNDTAKRRAEEGPAQPTESTGGKSKRTKDDLVPKQGRSIYQPARSATLENSFHGQDPVQTTLDQAHQTRTLGAFDYDQDLGLFDDRPFDTVEENEHYREEESGNTAQH